MTQSEVIVKVRGASRRYPMGKVVIDALKEVDIDISRGEFVCVAGPSGCGKTTLLNLVGCLDQPDEGTVTLENQETSKLSRRELALLRRNRIGFIFQTFNLLPVLSAYENVEYPLILLGLPDSERRARVVSALEAVGLQDHARHRPDELSGGQQQRVSIARALIGDPALVLADEPTANLDSETGEAIMKILHKLNQEQGTTFLFSSHDPAIIDQASRVVRLHDGRVVLSK
ncbi:ABC transporter ATP-binding protein [Candidatus Acetothermia bacterium]|nr:ABC transporter ATP-binding protein [Candidatus Acetothermia bacterium]